MFATKKNMIQFKDYSIIVTKKDSLLYDPEFEPIDETLLRMNNWIEENEIMVLNVETVVLPNALDTQTKRTTTKGAYKMGTGGEKVWWYQIFRVWYQA